MPECSYCGHDCSPNADACPNCGDKLKDIRKGVAKHKRLPGWECPNCGTDAEPGWVENQFIGYHYCPVCGSKTPTPPTPEAARRAWQMRMFQWLHILAPLALLFWFFFINE